jgi:hypothetical protein
MFKGFGSGDSVVVMVGSAVVKILVTEGRSGFGFDSQMKLNSGVYSSQMCDLYCVKSSLSWAVLYVERLVWNDCCPQYLINTQLCRRCLSTFIRVLSPTRRDRLRSSQHKA